MLHRTGNPMRHVVVAVDASRNHGRGVIGGVGAYAREVGNWILHVDVADPHHLQGGQIHGDGLIISGMQDMASWLGERRLPIVNVTDQGLSGVVPTVCVDNARVGQRAAEHLLRRGFRQFAGFTQDDFPVSEHRYAGFARTVEAAGFECERVPFPEFGGRIAKWLAAKRPPLGVMAFHDSRARELAETAWEAGWRIPGDLAIVGVDNDPLFCEFGHVTLSSVVQPLHRIGYHAASMLDAWLDGGGGPEAAPAPDTRLAPITLIVRQSSDVWITENPHICGALEYIRRNIHVCFGVEQVADAVGLSRRHLGMLCREHLGQTTSKLITQARLDRAKQLLAREAQPIAEIAAACGFNSASYFGAVFHKNTGQTPGDYRAAVVGKPLSRRVGPNGVQFACGNEF